MGEAAPETPTTSLGRRDGNSWMTWKKRSARARR